MSLPGELVIEDTVGGTGEIVIYRGNHPIHGTVSVYVPDENLQPEHARAVKTNLYQSALRMRELSLLNLRCVIKALQVSQNPNEPFIITEYARHDLYELISNGITMERKRVFAILSQVLEAIVNLAATGWVIDRIHPRQIKLTQAHVGDIGLAIIEGMEQSVSVARDDTPAAAGRPNDVGTKTIVMKDTADSLTLPPQAKTARPADRTQPITGPPHTDTPSQDKATEDNALLEDDQSRLSETQENINSLGNIAYRLLFGRKYRSSDKSARANIRKLAGRWRKILERALSQDAEYCYDTYDSMLREVRKASNRNKRVALVSTPFLLLLAVIAAYFAYGQYREHRIMTSEAGQAIESFLDIVNETRDEVPELKVPQPYSPNAPDDRTILSPFSTIKPADKG